MSSMIFKNYQVNVGSPFEIKAPLNFDSIKKVSLNEIEDIAEEEEVIREQDPRELTDKAREQAQMIVEEAKREADILISTAESEISALKKTVEEEAWQKGYEDGLNAAQSEYAALLQEAESIKIQAGQDYEKILESIENDTVDVIMEVARKVICTEISINKEDILYLIKQAFEKCSNKEGIVLRVSQDDYSYVMDNITVLRSMIQGSPEFEVKKDASLNEGDCLVETLFGTIDAGVQTKIKKIEEAFRKIKGQ